MIWTLQDSRLLEMGLQIGGSGQSGSSDCWIWTLWGRWRNRKVRDKKVGNEKVGRWGNEKVGRWRNRKLGNEKVGRWRNIRVITEAGFSR